MNFPREFNIFYEFQGEQHRKPLIYGSTVDEGMIFIAEAFPNIMDDQFYQVLIAAVFKQDAPAILDRFPPQVKTYFKMHDLCLRSLIIVFIRQMIILGNCNEI